MFNPELYRKLHEMTLGDRLKRSLHYSGISVDEMAAELECHRNTIHGWTSNRTKPMPLVLRVWAQLTGVPYEWLRYGTWPDEEAAAS